MRLTWSTRLLRACLALWLVLSGGELSMVHACPMHGGATAAHVAGTHRMDVAMHHGTGHDHGPASSHSCSCVGDCAAAIGAVLVPTPPTFAVATERGALAEVPEWRNDVTVERAPHRLPFANGPPAGRLTA